MIIYIPLAGAEQSIKIVRYYIEKKGAETKDVLWSLSHNNTYQLTYKTVDETHITCTDDTFATLSWAMGSPTRKCSIHASRKYNTISIKGMLNGQAINKHIEIDDTPWFQATSLSLKGLINSGEKEIQFWTLRPETLKAYKLKAIKENSELFLIGNTPIEAVKIKLCLTGFLSPFWSSHYWFSTKDGSFLGFEGPADKSGLTRISVTYSGETQNASGHTDDKNPE